MTRRRMAPAFGSVVLEGTPVRPSGQDSAPGKSTMRTWRFVRERIQPLLDPTRCVLRYAGRIDSASPATASYKRHLEEQAAVIEGAFASEEMVWKRRVRVRRTG
jgi:2-oxoglutarate dehydrogenase complex dehydrogenase (E1) component-like enzyme